MGGCFESLFQYFDLCISSRGEFRGRALDERTFAVAVLLWLVSIYSQDGLIFFSGLLTVCDYDSKKTPFGLNIYIFNTTTSRGMFHTFGVIFGALRACCFIFGKDVLNLCDLAI